MLGRATRLCPKIEKNHFEIYDPVGVYDSLQDVSNMKPVVTKPNTKFEDLLNGLTTAKTNEEKAYIIDTIVAKLQRKRSKTGKKALEEFKYLTNGQDIEEFAKNIRNNILSKSAITDSENSSENKNEMDKFVDDIMSYKDALLVLDKDNYHYKRAVIIDDHEDELIEHTRGYGEGQKPEDYIESFKKFITEHINDIEALKTVCTKPAELTRESLKGLKLELDRYNFTEIQLNSAWNEMTNQDIVADIIAFIRQQALGSTLVSHETRVKNAFAKLRLNHNFNKTQLDWLKRIEKVMLDESVLDEQIFEMGAFKINGGFTHIDRRFGGNLREIIAEINEYLYEDGGKTA
jgi:type I restriction enzyme R subunit